MIVPDGWFAVPNISGRAPAKAPPKDRLLIGRNYANRVPGSPQRFMAEHLAWWSEEDGCFVRYRNDILQEAMYFHFHDWTYLTQTGPSTTDRPAPNLVAHGGQYKPNEDW